MRTVLRILFVLFILLLARLSVYTVDAGEYSFVTILGRHVATLDGSADGAGLHIGWPWPIQVVQRLDSRIQLFDLPAYENLTQDAAGKVDKTLTVEAYVVWRIPDPDAVERFVPRIGTLDKAQIILRPRVLGQIGALIGQRKMDEIINVRTDVVDGTMKKLRADMMASLKGQVLEEYGIELIDIRLRRFNYPTATSEYIFARIKSEREKKAEEYKADGETQYQNIISKAEEDYRVRLAKAGLDAERIKTAGDTEALRLRNAAHSKDEEFFAFLKEMEKLKSFLAENRTVLILSTKRPLFNLLFQPPRPGNPAVPPAVGPGKAKGVN